MDLRYRGGTFRPLGSHGHGICELGAAHEVKVAFIS